MARPNLENPSPDDLEHLRRFLEECDKVQVKPQVRKLVEEHFPHLLHKLEPPHTEQ